MSKTSGVHVWLALMKTHQAVQKRAEKSIADTGLCFTDFRILEILEHKGSLPVNTVGARTNLTSGSATTAIDRLQTRGLVERVTDPDDGRARIVRLTDNGTQLIGKVFAKHAKTMERTAAGLSLRERSELIGFLKKLGSSARKE